MKIIFIIIYTIFLGIAARHVIYGFGAGLCSSD